jgi:hypothetical protein
MDVRGHGLAMEAFDQGNSGGKIGGLRGKNGGRAGFKGRSMPQTFVTGIIDDGCDRTSRLYLKSYRHLHMSPWNRYGTLLLIRRRRFASNLSSCLGRVSQYPHVYPSR